jgi:AcrR family transcriptional regulator
VTAHALRSTRPYLPARARRGHLLDAAGRLVREGGWAALSMQGLAAAAGVSRQLVYAHFSSVEELSVATLTHLFERAYQATEAIVRSGDSLEATLGAAYAQLLDLPDEERRALRSLAGEVEPGRRGLARARLRLRSRIRDLWLPYVRQLTGLDDAEASAVVWMIITAGWGLIDSIAEGALSRRRGEEMFVRFAVQTLTAWRVSEHRSHRH